PGRRGEPNAASGTAGTGWCQRLDDLIGGWVALGETRRRCKCAGCRQGNGGQKGEGTHGKVLRWHGLHSYSTRRGSFRAGTLTEMRREFISEKCRTRRRSAPGGGSEIGLLQRAGLACLAAQHDPSIVERRDRWAVRDRNERRVRQPSLQRAIQFGFGFRI